MANIERTGHARWQGNLREGKGTLGTHSGVLSETAYSFRTRFEDQPGTNPEELIAAAHAACYAMAFSNYLAGLGHDPQEIAAEATCVMERLEGGLAITRMRMNVTGRVPGLDQARFEQLAHEADAKCPVSNLLRPGLKIELTAQLK